MDFGVRAFPGSLIPHELTDVGDHPVYSGGRIVLVKQCASAVGAKPGVDLSAFGSVKPGPHAVRLVIIRVLDNCHHHTALVHCSPDRRNYQSANQENRAKSAEITSHLSPPMLSFMGIKVYLLSSFIDLTKINISESLLAILS